MNSLLSLRPGTVLVVELCWNYPDVPGGGIEVVTQWLDFIYISIKYAGLSLRN